MKTFAELDLMAPVQRALADENYETPTPIQAGTIPPALEGRDVLGCAQTGTGKTAAFALPLLHRLGLRNRKAVSQRPFALVLAPTRELAIQIGESFADYGRHLHLRVSLVYGGVSQGGQVRTLKRGAHILVATPGRLLDLMNQGHIHLDQLEAFVLDEADRMLDMGFLPDLKRIISKLPPQRQSLFFSATMPPRIIELSQQLLQNPVSVNVTPKQTSVERIEQRLLFVERGNKNGQLLQILTNGDVDRALVFTKTKRGANTLAQKLDKGGIRATAIHGNKSQGARQRALEAFRRRQVQVLVATDVAARGIDIDGISHVVNYDMPMEPESYVHRIGRTGRAGAEGLALSFCTSAERRELRAIEQLIGQKIPFDAASAPASSRSPQSDSSQERRGNGSPRRRRTGAESSQRPRKQRPVRAASGAGSGESSGNKPRRKPRRKGMRHRQRVNQTS